jgi:hypothetical protein
MIADGVAAWRHPAREFVTVTTVTATDILKKYFKK